MRWPDAARRQLGLLRLLAPDTHLVTARTVAKGTATLGPVRDARRFTGQRDWRAVCLVLSTPGLILLSPRWQLTIYGQLRTGSRARIKSPFSRLRLSFAAYAEALLMADDGAVADEQTERSMADAAPTLAEGFRATA